MLNAQCESGSRFAHFLFLIPDPVTAHGHRRVHDEIEGRFVVFHVFRLEQLAEMKVELRVSDAAGTLVHSAAYHGQASRRTAVWPSKSLIEKTCNEALQQLLARIQDDPVWERL